MEKTTHSSLIRAGGRALTAASRVWLLVPRLMPLLLLSFLMAAGGAQTQLAGVVQESESGRPLPAANVQIAGTYQGTIANALGRFHLSPPSFPALVRVSYIGYRSEERLFPAMPETLVVIRLQPEPIPMGEMVVSAENPAEQIMRRVIERKRQWRESLKSYTAEAYTRLRLENDSAIVMISESTSKIFWDRERGSREVVAAAHQTANFARQMGPVGSGGIPNFYDDDIILAGYTFIGPTHPDALAYYHFRLADRLALDGQTVYDIRVTPRDVRQTTFSGSIYVQGESFALLEVDLETGQAIPPAPFFPAMFFRCQQQFSTFGREYWLPVDWRMSGALKIAMTGLSFPQVKFQFYASLSGYEPNAPLPDSLYAGPREVTPRRDRQVIALAPERRAIPLTFEEEKAYQTIDSSMTFMRAFKPQGIMARLIRIDARSDSVTISAGAAARQGARYLQLQPQPEVGFNRVTGWRLGGGVWLVQQSRSGLLARGAWNSGLRQWDYVLSGRWRSAGVKRVGVEVTQQRGAAEFAAGAPYAAWMTGVAALLGGRDYHHYYWRQEWQGELLWESLRQGIRIKAGYRRGRHEALASTTSWSLLRRPAADNPAAAAGMSAELFGFARFGDLDDNAGLTGLRRLTLVMERSAAVLGSDWTYWRMQGLLEWQFRTFYGRRLFPNTLELKLAAGRTLGEVPVQRLLHLDGSLGVYAPFGVFRTWRSRPVYGERYLALWLEHNFRGLPFELLGWRWLAERGIQLSVHAAGGRVWPGSAGRWLAESVDPAGPRHAEAGISLGGLATLGRLDFTCRLSGEPAWFVSAGIARLF